MVRVFYRSHYLAMGDNGKIVRVVQEALNRREYYPNQESLVVDGYFGPQTRSAVKLFQQDNGRPRTGELSLECLSVLIWPFDVVLSDPQEGLSVGTPELAANSTSAFSASSWINNLLQSTTGRLSLIPIVILIAVGTVYIVEKGYNAEVSILKMMELILSPPDKAPLSDNPEEIEADQRL